MEIASLLNSSQQMLLESAEVFAEKEISPLADKLDQKNEFPHHLWQKLGSQGFLGITIPEEYGGSELGYFEHALIMQAISRASASIGLSFAAHSNLCLNQIKLNGNAEQRKKYIPKLVTGEHVGALAMTESGAGSDVMGMQAKAEKKGDHYILSGSKMWITNGPTADIIVVYAQTKQTDNKNYLSAFIIESSFAGFKAAQKIDKLGMRGSETCELVFDNCMVPEENLLGELHAGSKVLMSGLDYERVILAAGPLGIMQNCLDIVLPYLQERTQFGKPIGSFQLMQGKLADMYTAYSSSQAYLYSVAKAADDGLLSRKDAAAVILFTAEQATKMSLEAIQCFGGNGYSNEYPAGRLLRDAKLYEIGAGTSEIRRMLIGREIFNTSQF